MHATIRDYLGQFTGKDVVYLPNPGNAGDSVMASATYQALDRTGTRYRLPSQHAFDSAGQFVLYGGGGNLYGRDRHSYRTLQRIHATAKHLTILPHTIRDVDDLLAEFRSNVTVIARERVTFDYLNSLPRRYETLLMDDMALGLDLPRLLNETSPFSVPAMVADFAASRLFRRSGHTSFDNVKRYVNPGPVAERLLTRPPGGVLNCFRQDGEATDIEIPADNVDLPLVFMFGVAPAPVAHHATRCMIETLQRFDEIRTNRLHVAISGALIGKRVLLYPNNYFKCEAVYAFSLQERFPNVAWMG